MAIMARSEASDPLVVLYTDALTEMNDLLGKMLGEEGLLRLLRGLNATQPETFGPSLLARLAEYGGGHPADDDETVVVLHHNAGHPQRLSLRETVTVYAKVLGLRRV
jgi:serine phosphatase RsbU (regulator of sigma subunit)